MINFSDYLTSDCASIVNIFFRHLVNWLGIDKIPTFRSLPHEIANIFCWTLMNWWVGSIKNEL